MKRRTAFAMLLTAALVLTGCGGGSGAQPATPAAPAAQTVETQQPQQVSAAPEAAPEPEPEAVWRYELTTQTIKDEFIGEGSVKLASIDYEYPELTAVCESEDGKCGEMPAEVQSVIDAFNQGVWNYVLELESASDLGQTALEQYNEMDPEYRNFFPAYYGITEIVDVPTRISGDLVEVQIFGSTFWGGAHGVEHVKNFHFDLKEGKFFDLPDLTDEPKKLRDMLAEDIINGIFDREEEGEYFGGFSQTIKGREAYNVSFGADGVDVIFDEYEIAPYASGLPSFTVPYEKLCRFLNERGRRLFDLTPETRVLGDYYDALELWYWFEGSAPLDYDDTREGTITNDYGTYEMPYLRFDEPGITTLAQLKARLLTRFSPELVEKRLEEATMAMFQEFDGVLYAAAAGRGTDWTVESVDYTVEWNAAKDGGRILADIHRCELDEDTMERYSTGEVDQVEFPFVLTDGGAVFSKFPTIW